MGWQCFVEVVVLQFLGVQEIWMMQCFVDYVGGEVDNFQFSEDESDLFVLEDFEQCVFEVDE